MEVRRVLFRTADRQIPWMEAMTDATENQTRRDTAPDSLAREVATPVPTVERTESLNTNDLHDLCDAAEAAIIDGGGFGWLKPPPRHTLEAFWKGVLLIPERMLFMARLDGRIARPWQIQKPPRNHEAQGFACNLTTK